ncbi:hypothetical protein ACWEF9_34165, partial [Streptomyces sp. NPDC004980]
DLPRSNSSHSSPARKGRTAVTELVGMPPSTYRREAARATAGMPSCVAKQVTGPVRNQEAPATEPQLA